jgi:hypothetical protein
VSLLLRTVWSVPACHDGEFAKVRGEDDQRRLQYSFLVQGVLFERADKRLV